MNDFCTFITRSPCKKAVVGVIPIFTEGTSCAYVVSYFKYDNHGMCYITYCVMWAYNYRIPYTLTVAMHIRPGIAICTLKICPDNMYRRKCSQHLQVLVTVYVHLNLAVLLSFFYCFIIFSLFTIFTVFFHLFIVCL